MDDQQLPLLANPPPPPPPSRLIYIPFTFICLLISILFSIMLTESILLTPSFTARFLLKPPVAKITRLSSYSFNSTHFNLDGTKNSTDLKIYHLDARLSLPNPDRDNFVPDTDHHHFGGRGCLYYKNECISSVPARLLIWDREKMEMFGEFEIDEAVLEEVEESRRVPFDWWMEAAYIVSEPGSWFEKIRVLRVECKDVKAAYPAGLGDLKQCEAQTWPIITCTWIERYRDWLLRFSKVRKGCPEEPLM